MDFWDWDSCWFQATIACIYPNSRSVYALFERHYMAHRTNLVVQTLSQILIMKHIEDLLQPFYSFFSHNPKKAQ
jgi:hypothetical protein